MQGAGLHDLTVLLPGLGAAIAMLSGLLGAEKQHCVEHVQTLLLMASFGCVCRSLGHTWTLLEQHGILKTTLPQALGHRP